MKLYRIKHAYTPGQYNTYIATKHIVDVYDFDGDSDELYPFPICFKFVAAYDADGDRYNTHPHIGKVFVLGTNGPSNWRVTEIETLETADTVDVEGTSLSLPPGWNN